MNDFKISKKQLFLMLDRLIPDGVEITWSYTAFDFVDDNGDGHLHFDGITADNCGYREGTPAHTSLGLCWENM